MRCVILGGGGFIGSAIADRLLLDRHKLRIFERPKIEKYRQFSADEDVEWSTGDLLSAQDVSDAIDGADMVLHLVSSTLPKSSNDDPIYDVESNLVGTLRLLKAMVIKKVSRIVFISSGGTVYGKVVYLPIDERHPTDPLVSYGITKLAIEKYLAMFENLHGVKNVTLRVTNPFGERQRIDTGQGAVGVFLHRALTGQPIDIWGDGSTIRDFIHVSDVADAFVRAIHYSGPYRVFNISSGTGKSLNELVYLIEDILGVSIECRRFAGRPFDAPVSILSNALAKEELKWEPKLSLREGIARTVAWMRTELAK
jgi:UDP-glucose 4-epimerase